MTALAADRIPDYTGEYKESYGPAAASTKFYTRAIVCSNTAGNLVPGSNTANLIVSGTAIKRFDNSTGAAGDVQVEFMWGQVEKFAIQGSSLDASDVNKNCFVYDDQTACDAATGTNSVKLGRIKRFETGAVYVEVAVFGPIDS